MGAEADSWIEFISEMTSEFGRSTPVVFSRAVTSDYSPALLKPNPNGSATTYTCEAAPLNFKLRNIDKVTIQSGEKMLWIPGVDTNGSSVSPKVGDTVDLGTVYKVLEVIPYETESTNCAFLLKIGI